MTDVAILVPSTAAPSRVGQATAVEQSRAVAEVQAAIVVAQQCPRDVQAAIESMKQSCRQKALAERAFFRYRRGTGTITGPSVHLARELARCWGNMQYGLAELRRDDAAGESEMQAYAWDVQTNTRNASTFIVPHVRDKREGPERLTEVREIYENNANMGARRVREAIFAILPPWFVEEAKALCVSTIADGGGKSLPQRVSEAIEGFDGLGVKASQLVAKLGYPSDKWTANDLAQLSIIYTSLGRGEVRLEEEFPPIVTTIEDLAPMPAEQKSRKSKPVEDVDVAWPTPAEVPAEGETA